MTVPPAARILAGLVLGLLLGLAAGPESRLIAPAQTLGGIWLDALRMTIIPLVFALVVNGIGSGLDAGGSTRLARRAMLLFLILLLASAVMATLLGQALLGDWTVAGLDGLRAGASAVPAVPTLAESLRALVPANPIAAAAQGAIVPVIVFALFFAVALRRIEAGRAAQIGQLLQGMAEVMLVIIGWVLLLAPVGVFALAFDVAARSGLAVGAALAWYVAVQVIASLVLITAGYALVALFAPRLLGAFARAVLPAQAVAFSTQSSLAALPAMLGAARSLGLPGGPAGTLLPLAVALFRIKAPTAITLVVLALARIEGVELGPEQLVLLMALAVLNNLVIAGLPNQVSFFAAYAPPAIALGVPIDLLPLLLAVDTIPDMFGTTANVTADVAVTTILARDVPERAPVAAPG